MLLYPAFFGPRTFEIMPGNNTIYIYKLHYKEKMTTYFTIKQITKMLTVNISRKFKYNKNIHNPNKINSSGYKTKIIRNSKHRISNLRLHLQIKTSHTCCDYLHLPFEKLVKIKKRAAQIDQGKGFR